MFSRREHIKYFTTCMEGLPSDYLELDTQRMVLLYFCVLGLDLLDGLSALPLGQREKIVAFVKRNQLHLVDGTGAKSQGFIGAPFCGRPANFAVEERARATSDECQCAAAGTVDQVQYSASTHLQSHLAMTYSSLCILATLGEPLQAGAKEEILAGLRQCQQPDGSFSTTATPTECDVRFVYCACAIVALLHPESPEEGVPCPIPFSDHFDVPRMCRFLRSCQTYEGGFGLAPGGEAQGGATYCAVAALVLTNTLEQTLSPQQRRLLTDWCMQRQCNGYNGRTNKPPDSCYSFWVGGTLKLLDAFQHTDRASTKHFLLGSCQFIINFSMQPETDDAAAAGAATTAPVPVFRHCVRCGFCKVPTYPPDVLHSFYSLVWLSLAAATAEAEEGSAEHKGESGTQPAAASVEDDSKLLRRFNVSMGLCEGRKLTFL